MTDDVQPVDVNYSALLEAVKAEIGVARVRAARAVSVELIGLVLADWAAAGGSACRRGVAYGGGGPVGG